jgi:cytochrome c peroxidase
MPLPADNPITLDKIALGRRLFSDPRLGRAGRMSCASCHRPDAGYAGSEARSRRADGTLNARHTPTLLNVGYQPHFGWDGRERSLEAMIEREWREQLGVDDLAAASARATDARDANAVIAALACFVRSIVSGDAPWDEHEAGIVGAVDERAIAGHHIFVRKAGCAACHLPPLYTDHAFHNAGAGTDIGREAVSGKPRDRGRFKTPTLRAVTTRKPLLHDGSAADHRAAVRFMLAGGHPNPNLDSGLTPLVLTDAQLSDLLVFLASLTPR